MKKESLDLIVSRELKKKNINSQTITFFLELLSDFLVADYLIIKPKVLAKKLDMKPRTINRYLQTLREKNIISDHKYMEQSKHSDRQVVKHRKLRLTRTGLDIIHGYYEEKEIQGKVISIE